MLTWINRISGRLIEIGRTQTGKEISHHGRIAGAVTLVLVGIDILVKSLQPEQLYKPEQSYWFWKLVLLTLLTLLLAYVIGFGLVTLFEYVLRLKEPQHLPAIDDSVDGVWVYKMKDAGSDFWTRGSIIEIVSNVWDFGIKGLSYSKADLETGLNSGGFDARGSVWGDGKINFTYRGYEKGGENGHEHDVEDTGVGYYEFYGSEKDLYVRGAFTGLLGPARTMITRRFEGERVCRDINQCARKAAKETLRTLLTGEPTASGFAGTWVDAIYERSNGKWQLIQGSIIEINPNTSDSRYFRIKGRCYRLEDVPQLRLRQRFSFFDGEARLSEHASKFPVLYCLCEGYEHTRNQGVARYELHIGNNVDQDRFVGEFTRGQEPSLRVFFGEKIHEEDPNQQMKLLHTYLEECRKNPPADFLCPVMAAK